MKADNSRKKAENMCQRGRREIGEQVIMDPKKACLSEKIKISML